MYEEEFKQSATVFIAKFKQTTHSLNGQTGGTNSIINKPNSMTGLNAKPHLYTL